MEEALNLRKAFSQFATGVAIVTIKQAEAVYGMTVNSFTSVSLSPPLILWCLDQGKEHQRSFGLFSGARDFGVSVLAREQIELARQMAYHEQHRLEAGLLLEDSLLIKGALAGFECSVYEHVRGGDHLIIIAKVKQARLLNEGGQPLIFHHRLYRHLE